MTQIKRQDSRDLLNRLRESLAKSGDGQERLDHLVDIVADSLQTEVCSIYLCRDPITLELCATHGLNKDAVHQTRMRLGEGLVGQIAKRAAPINTENAPVHKHFRYMPETAEDSFLSLMGVPIQRLGEILGVLVVQSTKARKHSDDEVYALEIVAMVIAEMKELGAFIGDSEAMKLPHQKPHLFKGIRAQEGSAIGQVLLHDAKIVVSNVVADDPESEKQRLDVALEELRLKVDDLLDNTAQHETTQKDVLNAYRMFANSKGWRQRLETSIDSGLSAEVAVEKEQSATRARMERVPDPYLRERLHDLDDLSNRLLRLLTGQNQRQNEKIPENAILVARNIGPSELLEYGKTIKGIVLEEGSVGSHAAIIARAWAIPMVIHAESITREALKDDLILLDGDKGFVHLRPTDDVTHAFRDKLAMEDVTQEKYRAIRTKPGQTLDGVRIGLQMNAGLLVDLPSLEGSGAEGVGLFRTELQFLMRAEVPKRHELAALYSRVMDRAAHLPVTFRTLDIGSDKVLSYMKNIDEPNPAMGWRAIRMGLDKPGMMKMQLQALLRAAKGRDLRIMFPFVAQLEEYRQARAMLDEVVKGERALGHAIPDLKIGAMLETPSLAFAPDTFFQECDFISIGGNDLKQFFYAADRQNERVRARYDTLNVSYLSFIRQICDRCDTFGTPVSFCGEDAGKPVVAACFAAMGLRNLSMRPVSIAQVKSLLRQVDLAELRAVIDKACQSGVASVRADVMAYLGDRRG